MPTLKQSFLPSGSGIGMMTSGVFCLIMIGIVAALLIANYIAVTIQERREGKAPAWTPDDIDWEAAGDLGVQADIHRGNKIQAIKTYRELTGVGLKEAKDVIEFLSANPDMMDKMDKKKKPAADSMDAGVRDLIADGRLDEAVEVYQKFAGVDEYTARDAVERMKREIKSGG